MPFHLLDKHIHIGVLYLYVYVCPVVGQNETKKGTEKCARTMEEGEMEKKATTAVIKRPQEWIVSREDFEVLTEKGRTATGLIGRVVRLSDGRTTVWSDSQIARAEKRAFKTAVDARYFRETSLAALEMTPGECRRFEIEIPALDMAGRIQWGGESLSLAAMRLAFGARALQQGALVRLSAPTAERRPDGSAIVAFDATKMPRREAFQIRKADGAGLAGLLEEFKKLL